MKKLFAQFALTVAGFSGVLFSQQDPQFTQFMFNKLIYNPGYAGTSGAICGVAQIRQQWVGFDGAPKTIAFAGDMRLPGLPLGVGITVMNDKIGAMNTFFLRFAGSYNVKIGDGTLGAGIDLGVQQRVIDVAKTADGKWITPEPIKLDPSIPYDKFSKTSYDMGAGVFYQIPKKFYVGLSSTHLPSQTIKSGDNLGFKVKRHYYFMTGATIDVLPNDWLKVCPNILFKTDAASSSLDANVNLLWFNMAWVGATYRVNDAASLLLGYQNFALGQNALSYKIGYSYDFPTSTIKKYTSGTHEIILGVCYTPKVKKITTYANDRFLD